VGYWDGKIIFFLNTLQRERRSKRRIWRRSKENRRRRCGIDPHSNRYETTARR